MCNQKEIALNKTNRNFMKKLTDPVRLCSGPTKSSLKKPIRTALIDHTYILKYQVGNFTATFGWLMDHKPLLENEFLQNLSTNKLKCQSALSGI